MTSKPILPTTPAALPEATFPLTRQPALPEAWTDAPDAQTRLWAAIAQAPRSLLICDYDGTLAPFKADKMTALPFPGIADRLQQLAALPSITLALVSGRPVVELITLYPPAAQLTLYGSHGREHRSADGAYRLQQASTPVRQALDAAADELTRLGYGEALERKEGSLAAHWRNLSPAGQANLANAARTVFAQHAREDADRAGLSVLPFESGMELRANDHTKAHAVEALLAASEEDTVAAYLGDDTTDEDAFCALGERGLSLLIRDEPRPSLADYWLRPPAQLLAFLDHWLQAAGGAS